MGFFDRLFGTGTREPRPDATPYRPRAQDAGRGPTPRTDDEIAVERYRYLLRTAPPEAIEQAHEEAFSKLTPEQRRLLFTQLSTDAAPGDAPRSDDPHSLAQSATRSELRQPGTMERTMTGPSFGSVVGGSLLGTVAGYVLASALVSTFLPNPSTEADGGGADSGSADSDSGGDSGGGGDFSAGDAGSDFGGGFGGGDFGGGDFGF